MKIKYMQMLRILAKHLFKKTSRETLPENMTAAVAASLKSTIEMNYAKMLRDSGILVDDWIDLDLLEEKLKAFFDAFPIYQHKFLQGVIQIMWIDAKAFLDECKRYAKANNAVETPKVICLPYAA